MTNHTTSFLMKIPNIKERTFKFMSGCILAFVIDVVIFQSLSVTILQRILTDQSTSDFVHHHSLRQVHSIGNGENNKFSFRFGWPIKNVVHNGLFPGPK